MFLKFKKKKNRRGSAMTEYSLYGVLVVAGIAGLVVMFKGQYDDSKARDTSAQLTRMHSIVKNAYANSNSYGTASLANLMIGHSFPKNQVITTPAPTTLKTPSGKALSVFGVTSTFRFRYIGLNTPECESVLGTIINLNGAHSIYYGSRTTTIPNITPAFVSTTCNKSTIGELNLFSS